MAANIFSQMLGVPSYDVSMNTGGHNGFQMMASNLTLPPIHYSDAESDAESEVVDPNKRQHAYRRLKNDEIRLLILNPGEPDEPIECYLEHYPVESTKGYLALSYVWGSTENPYHIVLDGCTVSITANLGAFLRTRRAKFQPLVLWIDALCINQHDVDEKGSQIRLMKRVYEGAGQIVIWLGHAVENTEAAFEYVEQKFASDESTSSHEHDDVTRDMERLQLGPSEAEDIPADALDGIKDLLARPWWTRIWVYQEATAPAKQGSVVLCGTHQVDFQALRSCVSNMYRVNPGQSYNRTALIMDEYSRIRRAYQDTGISQYLLLADLLPSLRDFEATNPRDKLYALIPTSIDGNDLLDVDYSLSVKDVYLNSACNIMRRSNSIDLLGHCSPPSKSFGFDLPSWVPDWTERKTAFHLFKRSDEGKLYNACGDFDVDFELHLESKTLTSIGLIVDTIKHVSPSSGDAIAKTSLITTWTMWLSEVGFSPSSSLNSPYSADTSVEDLLLSNLVADCNRVGLDMGIRFSTMKPGMMTQDLRHRIKEGISDSGHNSLRGPHPAFLHRNLILTKAGYLGLAPKHTREGDLVTILGGAQVPMVLRRDKSEPSRFSFVGEAYIHGIMDGQAVQGEVLSNSQMLEIL
jgi:hypothetical protein